MRIFSFLLLAILLGLSSGCKSKKPPVDKNAESAKQTPAVTTPAAATGTPVAPLW